MLETVIGMPHTMPDDSPPEYREQFASIKYQMPPMTACASWIRQSSDEQGVFQARIVILAPDEKRTEVEGSSLDFQMMAPMHKTIMQTPPIGLRIHGIYRIRVQLRPKDGEWADIAEHRFLVVFPEQLQEARAQAAAPAEDGPQAPVPENANSPS